MYERQLTNLEREQVQIEKMKFKDIGYRFPYISRTQSNSIM